CTRRAYYSNLDYFDYW
nr:immunoglobulin heavy chain junction region [Mus musculus]